MMCTWKPVPEVTLMGFPCKHCGHAIEFHLSPRACIACRLEFFLDAEGVPG